MAAFFVMSNVTYESMIETNFAEYINAAITLVVGIAAFATYWLQKYHERQNAARIVIADIRRAEQVVFTFLERNHIDVWTRDVLTEDNWSKYKHLFAQKLTGDDLAALNRFFTAAAQMSDALRRMREIYYSGLDEKARLTQQALAKIPLCPDDQLQQKITEVMAQMNRDTPVFDPHEPKQRFFVNLQQMGRLSNTPCFVVLKRMARDL